jgi:hypothetical protein
VGGGEAIQLVVELPVERVAADLGELDDVLHGRRVESVLGDRQRQRLEQPPALIRGNGVGRDRMRTAGRQLRRSGGFECWQKFWVRLDSNKEQFEFIL